MSSNSRPESNIL
uniref:Uncharacterized protein n=1 Tax=Rhizophora mucronata TaxID=61149 RepID=A0A2P2QB54_RHIMU